MAFCYPTNRQQHSLSFTSSSVSSSLVRTGRSPTTVCQFVYHRLVFAQYEILKDGSDKICYRRCAPQGHHCLSPNISTNHAKESLFRYPLLLHITQLSKGAIRLFPGSSERVVKELIVLCGKFTWDIRSFRSWWKKPSLFPLPWIYPLRASPAFFEYKVRRPSFCSPYVSPAPI